MGTVITWAETEIRHIIEDTRDRFENYPSKAPAVLGISGGVDSAVTAALLKEALGPERIYGVIFGDSYPWRDEYQDACFVAGWAGIPACQMGMGPETSACRELEDAEDPWTGFNARLDIPKAEGFLPGTIRMAMLYGVSRALPETGCVISASSWPKNYLGQNEGGVPGEYSLLADYTSTEVHLLGQVLGLPERILCKTPTGESCLGFTYQELDGYLLWGSRHTGEQAMERIRQKRARRPVTMPYCRAGSSLRARRNIYLEYRKTQ